MDIPMDLAEVAARVKEKRRIFQEYNFGPLKEDALKTFYDLAQEYETIENFYRVSVGVIKEFFGLDSRLYQVCSEGRLELMCDSSGALSRKDPAARPCPSGQPGLYRRWRLGHPHPGQPAPGEPAALLCQGPDHRDAGILPGRADFPGDKFFFEKFANRLGYNLHVKIIARQNIQHIRFINSLVADIEHNVIIPNISLASTSGI